MFWLALFLRMARRSSRSGGWMSVIRPASNLVRIRSSRVVSSFGGRSEVMMICLLHSCRASKVWKNSICVESLPAMNWISSMRSISALRYFSRKAALVCARIASMSWFMNSSPLT